MDNPSDQKFVNFDNIGSLLAESIYADIAPDLKQEAQPLYLLPSLTSKVKKIISKRPDFLPPSHDQTAVLAKEIQDSLISLLRLFEVELDTIEKIAPTIEATATRVLSNLTFQKPTPN